MMGNSSTLGPIAGFWLRVLGMAVAIIAGAFIVRHLHLGWPGVFVLLLLAAATVIPLIRYTERRGEATGCMTPAIRRYNRRMIVSTFIYVIALFSAIFISKEWRPQGPLVWLIALLPSVGIVAMLWAMALLLSDEEDEYLRWRLVQSALFAGGVLLVVATVWGFFEQFNLVPHVPSWAAVPVFSVGLGLANCVKRTRP